jgi:DNA polymerase-3 subunit gamma/tau
MSTLYRKYRPSIFSEISGQEYVIKTLTNAIKNDQISHAYLFTGPRGTGKTTTARIFAKAVNCLNPITKTNNKIVSLEPCNKCQNCQTIIKNQAIDLIEIDAASHTGVDNIRQLKEAINIPPTNFHYKVFIIDEVHMLSMGAFNALLKTLEEPPAHAIFILATTELHKVPETILSRCQRFNIKPLTKDQIIKRLSQIAKKEKITISKNSLDLIATEANGGMRDAESLLGQIISLGSKKITAEEIQHTLGSSSKKSLLDLISIIAKNDLPKIIEVINNLQTEGINLKTFSNQLLNYFRNLMLLKISPEANEELLKKLTGEEIIQLKDVNKSFALQNLILIISLLQVSQNKTNQSDIPQLPLEMALIEYSLKINPLRSELKNTSQITSHQNKIFKKNLKKNSQKQTKSEASQLKNSSSTLTPKMTKKLITSDKKSSPGVDTNSPETTKTLSNENSRQLLNIKIFLDNWADILTEMRSENQSVLAFLKNCAPVMMSGPNVLIKTKYSFHKDKLNEIKNRLTIEKVFAKILEVPLRVKFVTEDELPDDNKISKSSINIPQENIKTAQNLPDKKTTTENSSSIKTADDLLYEAMKKVGGKIIKE